MSNCPFCRKPFIDCECKGRCVHCNQVAGAEGRADLFLSMVMSGKLIKPGKKLSAALADANEWKQQHENLLAVRQQDITALSAKIEQLESQLANARKADNELADKLEALLFAHKNNQHKDSAQPIIALLDELLSNAPAIIDALKEKA